MSIGDLIKANGVEPFYAPLQRSPGSLPVFSIFYPLGESEMTPIGIKQACEQRGWHFVDEFTDLHMSPNAPAFKRCSWMFKLLPVEKVPPVVFHAAPSEKVPSIRATGLRRSQGKLESTSGWRSGSDFIHVTEDARGAKGMAKEINAHRESVGLPIIDKWSLVRVSLKGMDILFCVDPFLLGAWIIVGQDIPPDRLTFKSIES